MAAESAAGVDQPLPQALSVDDHAPDRPLSDDLATALAGRHGEGNRAPDDLRDDRADLHLRPDRRCGPVFDVDAGPDRRVPLRERVVHRRAGRGLEPRQESWRAEDGQITGAHGIRRVVVGDPEAEFGLAPNEIHGGTVCRPQLRCARRHPCAAMGAASALGRTTGPSNRGEWRLRVGALSVATASRPGNRRA